VPGEPAADTEVAAVRTAASGGHDLSAGVEPRLALRRSTARPASIAADHTKSASDDVSLAHAFILHVT
jgi:hypothetical protein